MLHGLCFGAAISDTIAGSSIAFGNSVSADRIVVATSRFFKVLEKSDSKSSFCRFGIEIRF